MIRLAEPQDIIEFPGKTSTVDGELEAPDPRVDKSQEHLKPMKELENIILIEDCPTNIVQLGTKLSA